MKSLYEAVTSIKSYVDDFDMRNTVGAKRVITVMVLIVGDIYEVTTSEIWKMLRGVGVERSDLCD